jgi:hypothetical protein
MKPKALAEYLQFAIQNQFPILITGQPGIGKSDIGGQAADQAGANLILSHPVVSDPTDYKGLPFPNDDHTAAKFLPFGDLQQIIEAKEPTVFFLDDLGQAPVSVQAACMQLLLARRINGHIIGPHVTFIAATNRKQDKAAVNTMPEPVKSRFTIIELQVDSNDWADWALDNNMPIELIAFIRFRPDLLDNFIPSKDLVNSASPRSVTNVGRQQAAGLPRKFEYEVFKGAAGEAFASEYIGFLKMHRDLPTLDEIILNPQKAPVPKDPCALYAISAGLGKEMNDQSIGTICIYLDRLPPEISIACMQDAVTRKRSITKNAAFIKWAVKHKSTLI